MYSVHIALSKFDSIGIFLFRFDNNENPQNAIISFWNIILKKYHSFVQVLQGLRTAVVPKYLHHLVSLERKKKKKKLLPCTKFHHHNIKTSKWSAVGSSVAGK